MITDPSLNSTDECWNRIGIRGDRTCDELKEHVHCHNCPVFAARGKALFDRVPPVGYRDEWAERLAARDEVAPSNVINLLVFRVAEEWLACDISMVVEVTNARPAHRIPHRSNDILAGIVNIRGELQLAIRLEPLLDLPFDLDAAFASDDVNRRLLVLEQAGSRWAASIDEVHGVYPFTAPEHLNVPVTVAQHRSSLICDVYQWEQRQVGRLNGPKLFETLRGKIG